ncbi:serine/threonine-protein kinase [Streptomyces ochraceiscleroticus]|uniref:non-specific serine/threonine protein kinase n=1 Tax=Streptomyces ochraceiscleroticus TaxID=47761 RepID=A0ABW1MNL4_9ACTN|nr:serine/threonine-protein kinase [Streptomyces ochraceiscleroticus]
MGEVFAGRYELIDPIGRGGVGAVWRAWDQRRRRYVAAKVLQQSDAHTLLRFVREQALRIDHPHVVAPASWAANDDKVLFTMDLVNGGSLAHLVGDYGPLPPRYVCLLLDQVLSGLAAVHAEGVVHRDIKPANILLEATGTGRPHVRVSDFGISMRKGEPRLTEADYVVGTPGYFAPEQLLGAEPDFPADLFAVGLLALYLLTGSKPDSQALVDHFTQHGVPGAPEGVPEPLWQVLAGLLQPDPDARFKTANGARKAVLSAVELLPEETVEDEIVEVFDHIGPLPSGYGPDGPVGGGTQGSGARGNGAQGSGPSGGPVSGPRMPGTGSFPSAPPVPQEPPSRTPTPTPLPAPDMQPYAPPAQRYEPSVQPYVPPVRTYEPTAAAQQDLPQTRPYTVGQPRVPHRTPAPAGPGAQPPAAPGAQHAKPARPGPSPKVAVPVLVVALLCIAVGIWALIAS